MNCYLNIKSDVFDITNRIKSIDKNYYILYNLKRKSFEVHYKRLKNTYELTLPFDTLDSRSVDFVQKTRIENRQKIIAEIEESNKRVEQKRASSIIENAREKI